MSIVADAVRDLRGLPEAATIPALDGLLSPDEPTVARSLAILELAHARAYHGVRRQYDVMSAAVAVARMAQLEILPGESWEDIGEVERERDYQREMSDALYFVSNDRRNRRGANPQAPDLPDDLGAIGYMQLTNIVSRCMSAGAFWDARRCAGEIRRRGGHKLAEKIFRLTRGRY